MKLKQLSTIVSIYGLLLIAGGIIGYAIAKSPLSLACGLVFGTITLIFGSNIPKNPLLGACGSLIISLIMMIFFIFRLAKTHKIMPAALMIVMSAACAIILSLFIYKKNRDRSNR